MTDSKGWKIVSVDTEVSKTGQARLTPEVVDAAISEYVGIGYERFLDEERSFIRGDLSRSKLFDGAVEAFARNFPGSRYNSALAGFLLAHRILRYAYGGSAIDMPPLTRNNRKELLSKAVEYDFGDEMTRIFERHPEIEVFLANSLTNEESRYGAKLMLLTCVDLSAKSNAA